MRNNTSELLIVNGWTLLFHDCILSQLQKLQNACQRANYSSSNANVKLFEAVNALMYGIIPQNPASENFLQGNTLGRENSHWKRAKIGRRFRLFFRYDSKSKIIIYAWINDTSTLRSAGSKTDSYAVFQKMLKSGNPPTDWNDLLESCKKE